jgi:hypothetical protein
MNRDDYQLHGIAIVCDLGCIADASGVLPQTLANDADWAYFQDQLDRAAITILGRRGHERAPNPKGRKRMIVSSSVATIERRADGYWWWNPAGLPLLRALAVAAPGGGIVAVAGGTRVFDLFLRAGYDAFHLSHNHGVGLVGGVKAFSALATGGTPEGILARAGLIARDRRILDPQGPVTLTIWRRPDR